MSIHKSRRRAFTLVEMLVVMAIIGVMVALLLPGIQMAREASRRAKCTNNLRNLAMAVEQFHIQYSKLPPNRYGGCAKDQTSSIYNGPYENSGSWSWIAMVLPHLQQQAIYSQGNLTPLDPLPGARAKFGTLAETPAVTSWYLPLFFCPSDALPKTYNERTVYMRDVHAGMTNYKGSRGAFFVDLSYPDPANNPRMNAKPTPLPTTNDGFLCRNDGVLFPSEPQLARSLDNVVKDGKSRTILIGEQFWNPNRGACGQYAKPMGEGMGFAWAHAVEATAFGNSRPNWTPPPAPAVEPDADGNIPDDPRDCKFLNYNGFSSRHTNGAMFTFCDSSTRFISNNVDLNVYRAQFTADGGKYDGPSELP